LYCYRREVAGARRRSAVSVYLVERRSGVVVARIESLGVVPRAAPESLLVALGRRRGLGILGAWRPTRSGRHRRTRVRRLTGDAAP
jgi:hypothetical protein